MTMKTLLIWIVTVNRQQLLKEFEHLSFKMKCSMAGIACYGFMSDNDSAQRIAEYAGVSKRTALRWMKGKNEPPLAVLKLLEITYTSGIPQDGIWKGYSFNRDQELISPEGYSMTPQSIQKFYMDKWVLEGKTAKISEQQREIENLNQQINNLKSLGMEAKRKELIRLANEMLELANEPEKSIKVA